MDIPTIEPTKFVAGDTVQWTRTFSDFPASAYDLKYVLVAKGQAYTIDGTMVTKVGDTFSISVPAATTADYVAGKYRWEAYVTSGELRYRADHGTLAIEPDLAAVDPAGVETRSFNRRMLDAITAVLEGKASKDAASYTIGGRSITKITPNDLEGWRQKYAWRVSREEGSAPQFFGARFDN